MKLFPSTILVTVNPDQKQSVTVNGMTFQLVANRGNYEQNGRETNPVLMEVIQAAENVPLQAGDMILGHHNVITDQIWQIDNRHVIPYDRWILAKLKEDGWLEAMPGNIICERVPKPQEIGEWTFESVALGYYPDRVKTDDGLVLGIRKWGDYEVCYNWNGEVRRKIVLWEEDVVCGIEEVTYASFGEMRQAVMDRYGEEHAEMWNKIMEK